ncbi:nucleotidyltransferase family protein [Paraglaciecola sp.]|uniref:nucleotidyltransferase family protein n=1 Tax=Paraglaciecola sp. TaxID=1920173 RepID=UPI0030F40285
MEKQLLSDPKLERLHALVYKNAIERQQLNWFSSACQIKLKLSTYRLIADISAKKNQLTELTQLLEGHDINVLLLKGMAFNGYFYSDNSPRGSSDIDLLVQPQDKAKFCQVLKLLATSVEKKSNDAFSGLFEETWRANITQPIYFDLHWYLSYPSLFNFDGSEMVKRSIQHPSYLSENLRMLSNEDHIVYLAMHMTKDCDFFGYGLIDCHEMICQQQPDIMKCFTIAEAWGIKTGLYYLLMQCKKYMHTPVDEGLMHSNQPGYVRNHLCVYAINNIFTTPSKLKTMTHRFKQLISVFLFCDSLSKAFLHNIVFIKRSIIK